MRVFLLASLTIAAAAPCHAQNGDPVTTQVAGREIVARDFVGPGQFAVSPEGVIEIPDYEFSVLLPERCRVLIGDSGGHVHGLVVTLGGDCRAPAYDRSMRIWADFNTAEQPDALTELGNGAWPCGPAKPDWAKDEWAGAIDGLRTALCRRDLADGKVEISLQAMAGKWPDQAGAAPRISYEINFLTTRAALDQDMAEFRAFVCSIDAIGAGSGSTLCAEQVS
jgi:hypothetical protein